MHSSFGCPVTNSSFAGKTVPRVAVDVDLPVRLSDYATLQETNAHVVCRSGTSDASQTQSKLIRTWELLRFHSKLEKSSDEVEDVKDDRPIGPASERSTFWPRI
jgi:hypothetical protein